MTEKGEYIKSECYRMKVGECIKFNRFEFSNAFAFGWPTIYETPIQAFLSSMMGSGCGVWRAKQDPETGDVIISRHEESKKRYYIDPDREHLFKRAENGTLERRIVCQYVLKTANIKKASKIVLLLLWMIYVLMLAMN